MVETSLAPAQPGAALAKPTSAWGLAPLRMNLLGRSKVTDSARSGTQEGTERSDTSESTESFDTTRGRSTRRGSTARKDTHAAALSLRNVCHNPAAALRTFNNFAQITLITLAMGALEIDDRRLLFFFACTTTLVVTLGILVLNLQTNIALAGKRPNASTPGLHA